MISFYFTLGTFIFFYLAMLWFALVWAVLAAIINPSVFLPYTAAALTIVGTITSKYIYYKNKFENYVKSF